VDQVVLLQPIFSPNSPTAVEALASGTFSPSEDDDECAQGMASLSQEGIGMPPVRSHQHLSGSQTPEIIVYPNRRRTTVWLLVSAVSCLLAFLIFVFILILIILVPATRNGAAIFTAVLMGGAGLATLSPIRALARLLASGEPTLVITPQGIRVGKLYGPFEMILPWEEIEAIYLFVGGVEKQLFIRPTNLAWFLSRFGLLTRFFLRLNSLNGAPITIAQSFLDKPIAEILDQLDDLYAREVEYYHIRLWRSHVR
jgi:hypothetical protein